VTEPPAQASSGPAAGASYGLVLVLAVLLALWGAFLVPLRIGGVAVPVSCVLALVGNALLGRAGGRLLGRAGAAGPCVVWLAVVLALSFQRREGDLVVPTTLSGLLFLVVGMVTSALVLSFGVPETLREPGPADR
jgi:hypothetical protein